MADYGVVDEHAVMVDNQQASTMGPLWVVPEYGTHAITDKLAASQLYPMLSLSIALTSKEQDKYTLSPLIHSSNDSYGETNIGGLLQNETTNDAEEDIQGPVELGYAADTTDGKPKAVDCPSHRWRDDPASGLYPWIPLFLPYAVVLQSGQPVHRGEMVWSHSHRQNQDRATYRQWTFWPRA
ncbi:hypothetical protein ACS72_15820 [Acinetobacter sp. VT 511]|nr:hypothetical protein ACS72_15820 [Acinetobacter sp. VT 511]